MALGVKGSYFLKVKFGEELIPLNPSLIEEFTIVQDMNKFLPSFHIALSDSSGDITHLAPSDSSVTRISVEIGRNVEAEPENSFDFVVFRKKPKSEFSAAAIYDVAGLLDIADPLFGPNYTRSFTNQTVKDVLEYVAKEELLVDSVDISSALDFEKLIVQPIWSNAQLINDLKKRLMGSNNESAYKCIIRRKNRKTEFVFRSIDELCKYQQPIAKFIVNDEPYKDYNPVVDYSIYDNYKMIGIFGSKKQEYGYYDYYTSKFVINNETYSDFFSLSKYLMIDGNDSEESNGLFDLGRNNEFTNNFKENVRSSYHNRLVDLVKMWIVTTGNPNIVPGHLIQLLFGSGLHAGNPASYQYSGYWLVEKVVHTFDDAFRTKLLLTRGGVDTDINTTLLPATKKK
jgi:hypothetical protein